MPRLFVIGQLERCTVLKRLHSVGGELRLLKGMRLLPSNGHEGMQAWESGRTAWVVDLERVDGTTAVSRRLNDLRGSRQLRVIRLPRRVSRFLFPGLWEPLFWDREGLPISFSQPLSCRGVGAFGSDGLERGL